MAKEPRTKIAAPRGVVAANNSNAAETPAPKAKNVWVKVLTTLAKPPNESETFRTVSSIGSPKSRIKKFLILLKTVT